MPADDVGPVLKARREERGIRAIDMAGHLGISDTFLYDLERGNRRWTNEVLEKYLEGLEVLGG
jgi:transcriptional regulator with XRE-family HTH domain